MDVHNLKIWPEYYRKVANGKKTFEIRRNDRDFKTGDILVLKEWHPKKEEYTGRFMEVRVTYSDDELPGLLDGFIALGIEVILKRNVHENHR